MKKIFALFFILLILPSIFAVELEVNNQFDQGETLFAKVSGTFISPLTKSNIVFYKEHTRIPMEYGVTKLEEEYYIDAFLTGKTQGNYSISIENARYMKGSEIIEEKITKNFSITDKLADFSITPGFVVPSKDFSLIIKNLQEGKITVQVNTNLNESPDRSILISPETSNEAFLDLTSGEEKQVNFKLSPGPAGLKKIIIKTNNTLYEVPVYLYALEGNQESTFSLEPSKFVYTFNPNVVTKKTVYLYNTGAADMENISIFLSDSLTPFVNASISKINSLKAGANTQFELIFSSKIETEAEGELKAKAGETIAYSSISLKFIRDYVAPLNQSGQSSTKTCAELQGISCNKEGFKCSKEMISAKDGWCCKGSCDSVTASSAGKIIAIIIALGLVGVTVWFYFHKYQKAKKPVDLLEVSKGKDAI